MITIIRNIAAGILMSLILTGCFQSIRPLVRAHIGTEQVYEKNYSLNQRLTAYVGQPLVKVKDYKVKKYKAKHMRASEDFVITGGIATIQGDSNTDYSIVGETTMDEQIYKVVYVSGIGILIKDDGGVHSKAINRGVVMVYTFIAKPPNLKFTELKEEVVDVSSNFLNYEIIYGGTDGKSITITYKEYTSDDLIKPAFSQSAVYEKGAKQIRFKDTIIKTHEVTSDKIVFTVIADNLAK